MPNLDKKSSIYLSSISILLIMRFAWEKSLGFHRKEGSRDELKEESRLEEFAGSEGTRK